MATKRRSFPPISPPNGFPFPPDTLHRQIVTTWAWIRLLMRLKVRLSRPFLTHPANWVTPCLLCADDRLRGSGSSSRGSGSSTRLTVVPDLSNNVPTQEIGWLRVSADIDLYCSTSTQLICGKTVLRAVMRLRHAARSRDQDGEP